MNWRNLGTACRINSIRAVYQPGICAREIAAALGVTKAVVCSFYHRYPEAFVEQPLRVRAVGTSPRRKKPGGAKPSPWTPEKRAKVGSMLADGCSSAKIAAEFGTTRNAIIGLVGRDDALVAIGFKSGVGRKRLSDEERRQRRNATVRKYRATLAPMSSGRPERKPFKPVVVSNNVKLMVQDWIAQNGVRRFERGDMTDYYHLTNWLRERGYHLSQVSSKYFLRDGQGRPRQMTWDKVIALVDNLRRAEGLQPIRIAS
jgi:hypothetical protein